MRDGWQVNRGAPPHCHVSAVSVYQPKVPHTQSPRDVPGGALTPPFAPFDPALADLPITFSFYSPDHTLQKQPELDRQRRRMHTR